MFHVENMTSDNLYICMLAMLKIAYNFWPCIAFMVGFCIWEHLQERPARVRLKTENAKNPYRRE